MIDRSLLANLLDDYKRNPPEPVDAARSASVRVHLGMIEAKSPSLDLAAVA